MTDSFPPHYTAVQTAELLYEAQAVELAKCVLQAVDDGLLDVPRNSEAGWIVYDFARYSRRLADTYDAHPGCYRRHTVANVQLTIFDIIEAQ